MPKNTKNKPPIEMPINSALFLQFINPKGAAQSIAAIKMPMKNKASNNKNTTATASLATSPDSFFTSLRAKIGVDSITSDCLFSFEKVKKCVAVERFETVIAFISQAVISKQQKMKTMRGVRTYMSVERDKLFIINILKVNKNTYFKFVNSIFQ